MQRVLYDCSCTVRARFSWSWWVLASRFRLRNLRMASFRIHDRPQALNGDRTTTGAVCLARNAGFQVEGREALRLDDKTTPCPVCGEVGTLVEGVPHFIIQGRPAVVDGALVACACPAGSNRVMATGGLGETTRSATTRQASQASISAQGGSISSHQACACRKQTAACHLQPP